MKRILPFCLCLCCVGLTSCFRTNLYVGNARPDDRKVKVSQESFNHHFVGGLIPGGNTTMTASEYVDDADSFVVQTSTGFLNGLVGGVTAGIPDPDQILSAGRGVEQDGGCRQGVCKRGGVV